MAVYAISDLHLSLSAQKPMDVFGGRWERYMEKIEAEWSSTVTAGDTVLLPGDFCWAAHIDGAVADFQFLHALPGKKILSKGNHDYWWATMSKMNRFLERHGFDSISFLHNSAVLLECGASPPSAGLPAWRPAADPIADLIAEPIAAAVAANEPTVATAVTTTEPVATVAVAAAKGWLCPDAPGFGPDDARLFARERGRLANSLAQASALLSQSAHAQTQTLTEARAPALPLTQAQTLTPASALPLAQAQASALLSLAQAQTHAPIQASAQPGAPAAAPLSPPLLPPLPRALIAMTHYPPFSKANRDIGFRDIICEYGPAICIYGHLHGKYARLAFEGSIDGTEYRMVSADHLQFRPLRLL